MKRRKGVGWMWSGMGIATVLPVDPESFGGWGLKDDHIRTEDERTTGYHFFKLIYLFYLEANYVAIL